MTNRYVKTKEELEKITFASGINDECFSQILKFIEPPMTELRIAKEIERILRKLGSGDLAFPTICVSGKRTALPHGEPSHKIVREGELLTLDFGATVDGYCGDMTRTIAIGKVSAEEKNIYNIVYKSQVAGCKAARAGIKCFQLDKVCRDIIEEAGYGKYFVHGTGHSIGKEVHEMPYINRKSKSKLFANMAITIEPGIYIPEKFGVRIEDLIIISDFDIINTNKSVKKLITIN
ncbi:MAG: M24 family metallopeptidase [Anaerovoracaceae bacterium]